MRAFALSMLVALVGCGSSVAPDAGDAGAAGSGDAGAAGSGDAGAADGSTGAGVEAGGEGGGGASDADGATSYPPCEQFMVGGTECSVDGGPVLQLGGHYCGGCEGRDLGGAVTAQPVGCIAVLPSGLPLLCVAACGECS